MRNNQETFDQEAGSSESLEKDPGQVSAGKSKRAKKRAAKQAAKLLQQARSQDQPTADSNAADHDQSLDAAENAPEETSNDSRSVTDTLIDVEPVSADLCLSPSTTETDGSNGEGQASVQDEQEDMQALQSFDESVINLEAAPIHEHAKHKPGDILFGKYRISEVLVSDSFSTIYRARDLSRNIRVLMEAIEIPDKWRPGLFARAARQAAALNHDNVLKLLAFEESPEGRPYFISEYLNFVRLSDLISDSGFIEQELEAIEALVQICQALEYAHGLGIVHGFLHPRNVFLVESDGAVQAKLANFAFAGLQEQLRAGVQAAQTQDLLTPQVDIAQLSLLTYYTLSGQIPCKQYGLDEAFNLFPDLKPDFDALEEARPDVRGKDELLQLLDDANDADDEWRVKSAREFADGLADWQRSVEQSLASRSAMAQKVAESSQQQAPAKKGKRKITNNMKTTVKRMVSLRMNQSAQEETAVMRMTDLASGKGPRRSPLASAGRILIALGVSLGALAGIAYALICHPDEVKDMWTNAAQQVAGVLPTKHADLEEVPVPAAKPRVTKAGKERQSAPVVAATVERKRENKLPPFNPISLRDFYRRDFVPDESNGDAHRRRFRIEYRVFNRDWLK